MCTFHNTGLVDRELQAPFIDLYVCFFGEVYAAEEKVELASRARDGREERELVSFVHGVFGAVCYVFSSRCGEIAEKQMWYVRSLDFISFQ